MPKSNQQRIREHLRTQVDGATLREMQRALGIRETTLLGALNAMPDAYIDRWAPGLYGHFRSVWCVIVPPENCPKPEAYRG